MQVWQDTSHWVVGRYVLMPDHLHLFAARQSTAVEFDSWAQYFKSQFTKRNKDSSCVWQTDHWDTRIRNREHYEEKLNYMFNNPARAGLVSDANEWKYKGVVHELRRELKENGRATLLRSFHRMQERLGGSLALPSTWVLDQIEGISATWLGVPIWKRSSTCSNSPNSTVLCH